GLGGRRPRRRRAGQSGPGGAPGEARLHPRAREGHPRPGRRPAGPHLQPRSRDPSANTGRARPRAGRDRSRAVRSPMSGVDSVLLVAFGGPTAAHEIRPFLEIVTRGRNIPAGRLDEVAHHYEQMPGSRSPLAELTFAQARGLEQALARVGPALPVFVGMRNWHPFLHETLAEMADKGARRALAIILSPLRTEASWERYMQDVAEARARVAGGPEVGFGQGGFVGQRVVAGVDERDAAVRAMAPGCGSC